MRKKITLKHRKQAQKHLLGWYDKNKRQLPWRLEGESNPYYTWLSEIMLQQTTVVTVIPYFLKFIQKWSDIHSFAEASLDDVLTQWAGLGYYARARNLHKCAKVIVNDFDGVFPKDEKTLLSLAGIGPYTASAIRSIAFDEQAVAVDGNVERVVSRYFGIQEKMPQSKPLLKEMAIELGIKNECPSDFTQAFMELGATVCTPKNTQCTLCPWQNDCVALDKNIVAELPMREPRKKKPIRRGLVFWIEREDGAFFVRKRSEKGLLGGMMEVPSTDWVNESDYQAEKQSNLYIQSPDFSMKWNKKKEEAVTHIFTHFQLKLDIVKRMKPYNNDDFIQDNGLWIFKKDIEEYAFPSLMKKIISYMS